MDKLQSYVHQIKTANNFEEAICVFANAVKHYGFDYYIFTQSNLSDAPDTLHHKYYSTTYPTAWQERYIDKMYFSVDPVHLRIMESQDPFFWSEYLQTISLTDEQSSMMKDAQKYGLIDGLAASYIRQGGDSYFVSVAKEEFIQNYDPALLSSFYLLSSYLVTVYENEEKASKITTRLTDKEKNIINLAAIGKADLDIATLSNISVNTVRYHWKNIFKKLETNNRVFAVIKAINSGLITPEQFELTTNNGSSISKKSSVM